MPGVQTISTVGSPEDCIDPSLRFTDAFNWRNEWTNHTVQEEDIGSGRNHQYTSRYNRGNEWYSKWLPDQTRNDQGRGKDHRTAVQNARFFFL